MRARATPTTARATNVRSVPFDERGRAGEGGVRATGRAMEQETSDSSGGSMQGGANTSYGRPAETRPPGDEDEAPDPYQHL